MQQQGQIPAGTIPPGTPEPSRPAPQQTSSRSMVSSAEVNGAAVYSPTGEHLGRIDHLMIDKRTGRITWAVMRFGSFLGLGGQDWPLPWDKLIWDTGLDGYVTDVTRSQLESAPDMPADWRENRDYRTRSYDHYGIAPWW